jgi:di/tricarboxylate transporter
MLALAPRLLASRKPAIDADANLRQYSVEVRVNEGGPYAGKTVEEAGLRGLPKLYLVGIERGGEVLAPVSAKRRMFGGDVLSFAGDVDSVVDVCRYEGLTVVQPGGAERAPSTRLIEAVVSDTCPLLGMTIREAHFRSRYDAAVVAVARGAERVTGRLGDIELRAGDTLLLEAGDDFLETHGRSRDFFLVSGVDGSEAPRSERANLALLFFGLMVLLATFANVEMLTAASLAAMAMIATGCCSIEQAKNSIDWSLLVAIAGALGIGAAMQTSGLAAAIGTNVIGLSGGSPWGALVAVYVVAMLLTELVTNNAAAVLVYPIAMSTAQSLGVSETPFIVALMVAASAGYATPFGYQTNLMVYGPGGYRFVDYVRLGVPLDLAYLVVTVILTPLVFPF